MLPPPCYDRGEGWKQRERWRVVFAIDGGESIVRINELVPKKLFSTPWSVMGIAINNIEGGKKNMVYLQLSVKAHKLQI
ncbi:hypothetical protein QVD17_30579 [Tagetes erecta]|uniref:Uncharacterized protein n=1 Tax=Tagetes erecta TaxID=13708 RepID=A0AAD8K870_TARER|nr:hypothetical protein QVD17_30579 [Tagetes erecta]